MASAAEEDVNQKIKEIEQFAKKILRKQQRIAQGRNGSGARVNTTLPSSPVKPGRTKALPPLDGRPQAGSALLKKGKTGRSGSVGGGGGMASTKSLGGSGKRTQYGRSGHNNTMNSTATTVVDEQGGSALLNSMTTTTSTVGGGAGSEDKQEHPIWNTYFDHLRDENYRSRSKTRQRNRLRRFVLDVHEMWMTHLEHLREHQGAPPSTIGTTAAMPGGSPVTGGGAGDEMEASPSQTTSPARADDSELATTTSPSKASPHRQQPAYEGIGLTGRRDTKAIAQGSSQIQSVSMQRALKGAYFSGRAKEPSVEFAEADLSRTPGFDTPRDPPCMSLAVINGVARMNIVPGAREFGRFGLWWEPSYPSCPVEPVTRPALSFKREPQLSSTNSVLVLATLAADIPDVYSPSKAWDDVSHMPSNPPEEVVLPWIPSHCSQAVTLLDERLISDLDGIMSETAFVYNTISEAFRANKRRRRSHTSTGYILNDSNKSFIAEPQLPTVVFGVTKSGAVSNDTSVTARNVWHSEACITEHLVQPRTASHYHYMLVNEKHRGTNDPSCFAVQMKNNEFQKLLTDAFGEFAEEYNRIKKNREVFAMREALARKIEIGVRKFEERQSELSHLMRQEAQEELERRIRPRFRDTPRAPRKDGEEELEKVEYDSGDEPWSDSDDEAGDDPAYEAGDMPEDHGDIRRLRKQQEVEVIAKQKKPKKVPDLELERKGLIYDNDTDEGLAGHDRGGGWRKLPKPEIPAGFFAKCTRTRTQGPPEEYQNTSNKPVFLSLLSPLDAITSKPEDFSLTIEAVRIPDARADYERIMKKIERDMRREEELGKEVSMKEVMDFGPSEFTSVERFMQREWQDEHALQRDPREEAIEKALLAAKTSNIAHMEEALEVEIDIDTTDEHGNTLLILACQQGSKNMAKFLLRRGAQINAQNLAGNTVFHFCKEYGHDELFQYLQSKGGDPTIVNGDRLTGYEGLSLEDEDEG